MMKKNFYSTIFSLIIFILLSTITYGQSKNFEVKVLVSPMQELTINEALSLSFEYPWEGMESGQALIFENIGNVNIKSNVDWFLNISSGQLYRDLEIYIKPTGKRNMDWQRIDNSSAVISGSSGSNDISWDIKVVSSRENYLLAGRAYRENNYTDLRNVNMVFTLTQL